jgi:hypothetical protein
VLHLGLFFRIAHTDSTKTGREKMQAPPSPQLLVPKNRPAYLETFSEFPAAHIAHYLSVATEIYPTVSVGCRSGALEAFVELKTGTHVFGVEPTPQLHVEEHKNLVRLSARRQYRSIAELLVQRPELPNKCFLLLPWTRPTRTSADDLCAVRDLNPATVVIVYDTRGNAAASAYLINWLGRDVDTQLLSSSQAIVDRMPVLSKEMEKTYEGARPLRKYTLMRLCRKLVNTEQTHAIALLRRSDVFIMPERLALLP